MIVVELFSVFKVLANYIMLDELYHMSMVLVFWGISEIFIDLNINKIDGELYEKYCESLRQRSDGDEDSDQEL